MTDTRNRPHCDTTFSDSDLPDHVQLLQAESFRIGAIIRTQNTRHSLVLQKLNSISSTPRALPAEVLSEIFKHAFPPPSFSSRISLSNLPDDNPTAKFSFHSTSGIFGLVPSPIALGAVCSRWRQIAWDTRELWTSVGLHSLPTISRNTAAAGLLQLYASNASGAALNVQIIFHWPSDINGPVQGVYAAVAHPLANTLFSQDLLIKMTMLVLSHPPSNWLPNLGKGFVHLHTFVFVGDRSYRRSPLTLINVPSLRHVSLAIYEPDAYTLPYDQLQTLTLRDMPVDAMFDLLLLCPNLTSYRARPPPSDDYFENNPVDFKGPRTFSNLQHFEWPCEYDRWSDQPQDIRLPALRYLHLHGGLPVDKLDMVDFFDALSKDIQTLHLTSLRFKDRDILDYFFPRVPQLETLIIDGGDILTHAIKLLSPQLLSRPGSSNLPSSLLPNLRTLRFENIPHPRFGMENGSLIRYLMKRMIMMNIVREFRLEIISNDAVQWSSRVKKTLRRFIVDKGAPLRVFTNDEEMFSH